MSMQNLKRLREQKGLTREQLADMSGVSVTRICAIEDGTAHTFSSKALLWLANALDTDVDQMVCSECDDNKTATGEDVTYPSAELGSGTALDLLYVSELYSKLSPNDQAAVKDHIHALLGGKHQSPELMLDEAGIIHSYSQHPLFCLRAGYELGLARGHGELVDNAELHEICVQILARIGNALRIGAPKTTDLRDGGDSDATE